MPPSSNLSENKMKANLCEESDLWDFLLWAVVLSWLQSVCFNISVQSRKSHEEPGLAATCAGCLGLACLGIGIWGIVDCYTYAQPGGASYSAVSVFNEAGTCSKSERKCTSDADCLYRTEVCNISTGDSSIDVDWCGELHNTDLWTVSAIMAWVLVVPCKYFVLSVMSSLVPLSRSHTCIVTDAPFTRRRPFAPFFKNVHFW